MIGKKFEKNNEAIALNILYVRNEKYSLIMFQNITEIVKNSFFLRISNGEKWYYLAVRKLSVLLRGITSKSHSDFYCLNWVYTFRTKIKLELHKRVCENKDFCNIIFPSDDTKILEFSQSHKSDKLLFIICADLECIIEKIHGCKNNPENSSTTKVY